ncbi:MAG: cysteine--tRNA ligase [Nitrospirae bacterium]|nr:MAG: cysteine--tRNA ligase [Nitrospirota bacterium]
MLKVYNTLSGKKEAFEPLVPGAVRMYVCGVTVYDECHLGHARSALVFDVVRRYLEHSGFSVTFVKNFTDVDDKIIKRANELGKPWQEITATYIDAYYRDMGRLGIKPATVEPKATEHMAEIVELVWALIQKGMAYQVNGDVYFQVDRYGSYGRLSKRKLDDMQAGARVEVDERKRHPMDFALWKGAKPGEPSWPSPWGPGRPGWHIECSAMAMKHLGETFDIHGGGMDLIFPHHENEIAQSCGATGKEFARYWLHNGFVQINQEKMSKSLGNFFTIREIFEKWGYQEAVTAEALRYFLLSSHYRSPLNFSDQALLEAKRALDDFYNLFMILDEPPSKKSREISDDDPLRKAAKELPKAVKDFQEDFCNRMDDDFNTPDAIAMFHKLLTLINIRLEIGFSEDCLKARETIRSFGKVLGLFQLPVRGWQFQDRAIKLEAFQLLPDTEVDRLLAERIDARKRKDFVRADEIRQALTAQGITLEDRPDGTTRWKR